MAKDFELGEYNENELLASYRSSVSKPLKKLIEDRYPTSGEIEVLIHRVFETLKYGAQKNRNKGMGLRAVEGMILGAKAGNLLMGKELLLFVIKVLNEKEAIPPTEQAALINALDRAHADYEKAHKWRTLHQSQESALPVHEKPGLTQGMREEIHRKILEGHRQSGKPVSPADTRLVELQGQIAEFLSMVYATTQITETDMVRFCKVTRDTLRMFLNTPDKLKSSTRESMVIGRETLCNFLMRLHPPIAVEKFETDFNELLEIKKMNKIEMSRDLKK